MKSMDEKGNTMPDERDTRAILTQGRRLVWMRAVPIRSDDLKRIHDHDDCLDCLRFNGIKNTATWWACGGDDSDGETLNYVQAYCDTHFGFGVNRLLETQDQLSDEIETLKTEVASLKGRMEI